MISSGISYSVPLPRLVHHDFGMLMSKLVCSHAYGELKDANNKIEIVTLISDQNQGLHVDLPSRAARALRKHCWGNFRILPETNGLSLHNCPLGSYHKYCLKLIFRIAPCALQFVLSMVICSTNSVLNFSCVCQSIASYNLTVEQMADTGRVVVSLPYKIDIGNFFENVSRYDVKMKWAWCLASFYKKFGKRRQYDNLPQKRFNNRASSSSSSCSSLGRSYLRSFHELLRCQRKPDNCPVLQHGPLCSSDKWIINVADIGSAIEYDFRFGILLLGTRQFLTEESCCQGSVMSPGMCLLASSWLKATNDVSPAPCVPRSWLCASWERQWVDDIYLASSSAIPRRDMSDPDAKDSILELCHNFLDFFCSERLAPFKPRLNMKIKDPSSFVGVHLSTFSGSIDAFPEPTITCEALPDRPCKCCLTISRFKFRHFLGCTKVCQKQRVVVSQIKQTVDRCSNVALLHRAIVFLFCEFAVVDFPYALPCSAVRQFVAVYPYLAFIAKSLTSASQLLNLTKPRVGSCVLTPDSAPLSLGTFPYRSRTSTWPSSAPQMRDFISMGTAPSGTTATTASVNTLKEAELLATSP